MSKTEKLRNGVLATDPTLAKYLERAVPRSQLASHELITPQGQQWTAGNRGGR